MKRIILTLALLATMLAPQTVQAGRWHNCRPTWGGQRCDDSADHTWVLCNAGWKADPPSLTCGVKP